VNPRWLLKQLGEQKPRVYLACGDRDELVSSTRLYEKLLTEAGVELHSVVDEGAHEWDYWDRHIKLALEWLPLDRRSGGLNSGNIKGE